MVSVSFNRSAFERLVGSELSQAQLKELLPRAKCGVDDVNEREVLCEVTGDRPDLLCTEGAARAVKGILGKEKGLPKLVVSPAKTFVKVHENVAAVRPFIFCAYIDGVKITGDEIAELMQVQEKLHLTHGRRRRKVAIGIHDAAKVSAPFSYKAVKGNEMAFIPLGKEEEMTFKDVLEKHEKGRDYAFVFEGVDKYPAVLDAKDRVVSFPPIINAAMTTVTESTKAFFLEITGTDFEACNAAANIICQNYSDKGAKITAVEIRYPDKKVVSPASEPEVMTIGVGEANKLLGTSLKAGEMAEALKKQRLGARVEGDFVACEIPRYRTDFLHPVDLVEEIALGIGYNELGIKEPTVFTKGSRTELSVETDSLRDAMAAAGYAEAATNVLCGEEALKARAGKPIRVKNPVSSEYSFVRNSIVPVLLAVLSKNTRHPYPQKLFEVGEVVERREGSETGTVTKINLCALSAHKDAGLSEIASVLAGVLKGAELKKLPSDQFIPGRCAQVVVGKKVVGVVGELHPEILEAFGIEMPVAAFEVTVGEI
ncbi:MAG: phenylalanine--tRNA ligase subunit beta [Candidatus Micrarchaeota archaeon]|nr:phenylalanine--tRNA ligase subunit beta [Candidatus Micrarchaeota archaeon]